MTSNANKRVVVTAMGCVTPAGRTTADTWAALLAGRSAVSAVSAFDATGYSTRIGAEIRGLDPEDFMDRKDVRRTDRSVHLAAAAASQCLAGVPLDRFDRNRVGVVVGSGIGGIHTFETQNQRLLERGPSKVSPFFIPMMITDMSSGYLSIHYGLTGPNYATVSACASGGNAVADAFLLIRAGMADAVVCGGTEAAITPMSLAGFGSLRAMSRRNDDPERASRPFEAGRDGFVLGEGAAILLLEELEHARRRGASILCEVSGVGLTGDAHHMTAPAPDGEGAARAMKAALSSAGVSRDGVDYINAHGTSTQLNDVGETLAIKRTFGDHAYKLKISSTKSMIGHLLGAAAAVELVICILTMRDGVIAPTINLDEPDPKCDLDYVPNVAHEASVTVSLSNSFGFGGHNVAIVVEKFNEE